MFIDVKEDLEIKFWKDWFNADLLKRTALVEKLPIIEQIWSTNKLPKK